MSKNRLRRGFSLVELLVVIGIIAVLVGLLLPALGRAREHAKTVRCAAQLTQINIALNNYASFYKWALPSWSGWQVEGGDGSGEDTPGEGWTEQLTKFLARPASQVYNCPSFPEGFRINYFLTARYSYLTGRRTMKLSEIRQSTKYVLSGDCTSPGLYPATFGNAGKTEDDCDKDDATQIGVLFSSEVGGLNMHRGGNNVLFADGHVELLRSFDAASMTYHPRKMQGWAMVTPD